MNIQKKIAVFTILFSNIFGCSRHLDRDPPGIRTLYEPGPYTTITSRKVCDPGLQKEECELRLHQAYLLEKPNGEKLLAEERKQKLEKENETRSWEINNFSSVETTNWKNNGFTLEESVAWRTAGFRPETAKEWNAKGFTHEKAKKITDQRDAQKRLKCHNGFPNPWSAYTGNPYALDGACVQLDLMAIKFFSKSRAIYQPVYRNSNNYFAIDFDSKSAPNYIFSSFLLGKPISIDGRDLVIIPAKLLYAREIDPFRSEH
jgi:hypothetical protein